MYISNDSINCHFIIKEETGGNNSQSTCSFRTSWSESPFWCRGNYFFISKKLYYKPILPETDSMISHSKLKTYVWGQEKDAKRWSLFFQDFFLEPKLNIQYVRSKISENW